MRDLALLGFFVMLLTLGLRRPFFFVLAYLYIDTFAPQRIAPVLATIQPSLVAFGLAVGGWLLARGRSSISLSFRQILIVVLLAYCAVTTVHADFPEAAAEKWSWVWKALVFAIFLPMTLRTRLRLESVALFMVLAVAPLIIDGGIKTLHGGGGYGELRLFSDNNFGLYEGSTLSCVAVAVIPVILWLARFGTVFPPDWRVRLFAAALIFACLLIPVGTVARTGLICVALLGLMMLLSVKRRALYLGLIGVGLLLAVPLLPASFIARMTTISDASADQSAATRLAVWDWTLDYVGSHPFGGGFESYLGNHLRIAIKTTAPGHHVAHVTETYDEARAFHSAYFEMLGEQGWPGLGLWLLLQLSGVWQLLRLRWSLRASADPLDRTDAALAAALQEGQIVYMVGAGFVGIAFQPFIYMLIGLQIALVRQVRQRHAEAGRISRAIPAPLAPRAA